LLLFSPATLLDFMYKVTGVIERATGPVRQQVTFIEVSKASRAFEHDLKEQIFLIFVLS